MAITDVWSGSLADLRARVMDVRFTPLRADMLNIGIEVCKMPIAEQEMNYYLGHPNQI
jgi:hypothetical protein